MNNVLDLNVGDRVHVKRDGFIVGTGKILRDM